MDELLMKVEGTQTVYYHEDRLGSVTHLTDASGTVVERYRYNPFGSPFIRNGEGWGSRTESAYNNRFLYTGREWLAKIGLYDYRNRAYSPNLGRFMQPDPIGFDAGDANIYRYVGNEPVGNTDPLGLCGGDCTGKDGKKFLLFDCWTQPKKQLQGNPNAWQAGCLLAKNGCEVCCATCFPNDTHGRCPRFCATQYALCIRGGGGMPAPPKP